MRICESLAIYTYSHLELVFSPPDLKTVAREGVVDCVKHTERLSKGIGAVKVLLLRIKQMQLSVGLFLIGDKARFADCVAFATFQHALNLFGLTDFLQDYPTLERWYNMFS